MLHEEFDGVATGTTTEAFVDLLAGRDGKRRAFFVMKRAEAKIVGTPLFQFNEIADDLYNVNAGKDLLYGLLRYHGAKLGVFSGNRFRLPMYEHRQG
jgi:hypothetical protein